MGKCAEDKYRILTVGNQFKMCGNPFRIDTYRGCSFGCKYCFANTRNGKFGIINKLDKSLDVEWLERQFEKAFVDEREYKDVTIEFLKHKTPLHMGGLSDPFQNREWNEKVTYNTIKVCNKYDYPIMFSTKTSSLPDEYWDILNNKIHAFQISLFTDSDETCRKYETNTPLPSERIEFIKELHNRGFWVGLRIQPLINIDEAISLIKKVKPYINYITVEHLKVGADNMIVRELFKNELETLPFFKASGRNYELAYNFKLDNINKIKSIAGDVPVGCGDNDLHDLTDSRCCCGIDTINKNFDNYLKYNQTYFLTGDCNKEELWTPNNNIKKCLNGDAVKKDMYLLKDYVDEYMNKFPKRMKLERKRGDKAYDDYISKQQNEIK